MSFALSPTELQARFDLLGYWRFYLRFGNQMICQGVIILIGHNNTLNEDLLGDVNKEVNSVEECEIVLQCDTSVDHLEKQLELNWINKCFLK